MTRGVFIVKKILDKGVGSMPKKKTSKTTTKADKPTNKAAVKKKLCCACNEEKILKNFYRSYNQLHSDGYMPMCKDCIKNACYNEGTDDVDLDKLKNLLRQLDRPFLLKYYQSALSQYEKQYSGKKVPKKHRLEIVGYYFKNIQTLTQIRGLNWEQGLAYNEESDVPSDTILTSTGANNELVYRLQEEEFEVTDEIVRLFGEGYTKKEYEAMKNKYEFLRQNYPSITNLHVEALVNYVRLKVKAEMAIARGNISEAKSWDDLATKAADKAKINPSQLSQSDLQGGLNSFSEVFQAVEQAVDVIPILPRFKYRPNDAPDFIIWCFINYIRNLEGKPECSYEDVYHFYDDRKKEYIDQYGDPYGIFTDDTTEKNRDKVKKFIEIPAGEG